MSVPTTQTSQSDLNAQPDLNSPHSEFPLIPTQSSQFVFPLQVTQTEKKTRKAGKRGKTWNREEDKQLCRSWLNVSVDSVRGTDNKNSTLWSSIHNDYVANINIPAVRSKCSLEQRWTTIHPIVSRFAGFFYQVEKNGHESDHTTMVEQANILYNRAVGKDFFLDHCWYILRDEQKWKDLVSHKNKKSEAVKRRVIDIEPEESEDGVDDNCSTESKRQNVQSDEVLNLFTKSQQDVMKRDEILLAKLTEQNDLLCEIKEIKIMKTDLSSLNSPDQVEYFRARQQIIMAKMHRQTSTE